MRKCFSKFQHYLHFMANTFGVGSNNIMVVKGEEITGIVCNSQTVIKIIPMLKRQSRVIFNVTNRKCLTVSACSVKYKQNVDAHMKLIINNL